MKKHVRGIGLYFASTAALAPGLLTTTDATAQGPALAVTTPSAEAMPSARAIESARKKFQKLSERKQQQVLAEVRAAVASIDSAYLRSLQPYANAGKQKGKARHKPLRGTKGKKSETAVDKASTLYDGLPLRARHAYRFAYGDIAPRDLVGKGKRVSKRTKNKAAALAELDTLLGGFAVDADLAFAAILRQLDNDRSADQHAVFLDSWKNGAETFYQALARTAGTGNGVFCYDAMLSDWVRRCIPKKHPVRKELMKSMDNTQKAFYQTAATYRAYRSIREVVALTLILPSDVPLPGRLGKLYEHKNAGEYSTRDCIELILAANDHDVGKTVDLILTHLERMPPAPWKSGFQGVHGIYAAQDAVTDILTKGGRGTDAVLAKTKRDSQALRDRVAQIATLTFVNAM